MHRCFVLIYYVACAVLYEKITNVIAFLIVNTSLRMDFMNSNFNIPVINKQMYYFLFYLRSARSIVTLNR